VKAYRFITAKRIEPFGDPVSECQVGVMPLGLAVTKELQQAGIEPLMGKVNGIQTNSILLPDTMFVTRKVIRKFIQNCPPGRGVFRLALKKGPLTRWLCPLANIDTNDEFVMFPCYLVRKQPPKASNWEQLHRQLSRSAQPVILDPGSRVTRIRVPTRTGTESMIPRTDMVAADVSHWVHLLWLNQLIPWIMLGQHEGKKNEDGCIMGDHCDVHPTALVENSILGDHVTIGPFASVRDCVLGDWVELTESSRLNRCCVGDRCRTLADSYFIGCTFFPGSTLANFMLRESIIGRGCFITSGLVFSAVGLTEPVHVNMHGDRVDSGRWLLGSAVGHGCTLGTLGLRGNIAPGMEIPNGYMIVMNPKDGLQSPCVNPRPMEPFMNVKGTATEVNASTYGRRS